MGSSRQFSTHLDWTVIVSPTTPVQLSVNTKTGEVRSDIIDTAPQGSCQASLIIVNHQAELWTIMNIEQGSQEQEEEVEEEEEEEKRREEEGE